MLQRSVWLFPHPAEELKRSLAKRKIDVSLIALLESRVDSPYASEMMVYISPGRICGWPAKKPPSTGRAAPVIKEARGDARNTTACAISSIVP